MHEGREAVQVARDILVGLALIGLMLVGGCRARSEAPARPPPQAPAPPAPAAATRSTAAASATHPPDPAPPWPPPMPPRAQTDWCIEAVGALDAETCFVLPEQPTELLLIYLHGVVPPEKTSAQKTTFETVVSNASRRANAAALMPRGKRGLGPKGLEKWWAWPTSEGATRSQGPEFAATIRDKKQKFEAATGIRFSRVYVAGSSSGAWFVASLALTGGLEADGYGAMSGGAGRATPELAKLAPKPFYIGYGTHDSVAAGARKLGDVLRAAGWPVRVAQHPVGHGAKEIYLDEAFAFWRESSTGDAERP